MNFGIFYDDRAQTDCNTNPAVAGNQPTGQMYGGYYAGVGPAGYHNGALNSDPRIAIDLVAWAARLYLSTETMSIS
jgi:hypothetical protein